MSCRVEYNAKGNPAYAAGKNVVISNKTTGKQAPVISSVSEFDSSSASGTSTKYINWGSNNSTPSEYEADIKANPVLKRALILNIQICIAQGLKPTRLKGFDNNGNEILEYVNDSELINLLNQSWIRRYITEAFASMNKYGNIFIQYRPNISGDGIAKIHVLPAIYSRLEAPVNDKVQGYIYSGYFPDNKGTAKRYDLLDYDDTFEHLQTLQLDKKLNKDYIQHIKNRFCGNPYYTEPNWHTAKIWCDVSNKIAQMTSSGLDNLLRVTVLIKIPDAYWDWKFPVDQYENNLEVRKDAIQAMIDQIIDDFTKVENSSKAMVLTHSYNNLSKEDTLWEIEVVDYKFDSEKLKDATAADTQIAIASGINPDMMGLMYGNSKGGSMQRELFLMLDALNWEQRQTILDPIENLIRINFGKKFETVELRFKQTFLTTLDTGKQTGTMIN